MQLAALGLDMISVHAFALQAIPPVAYPHELPAPSVVVLHAVADVKLNDVQTVATTHYVPLNEHDAR